jgi:hypothetical protein
MKAVNMNWKFEGHGHTLFTEDDEAYLDSEVDDDDIVEVVSCTPRILANPRAEDSFFGCLDRGLDAPQALAWRAGLDPRPPPIPMQQPAYGVTVDEEEGGAQDLPVQGDAWAWDRVVIKTKSSTKRKGPRDRPT